MTQEDPDGYVLKRFLVMSDSVGEGKTYVTLALLDEAGELTSDRSYFLAGKATRSLNVGSVYEIPVKEHSFTFGRAKWVEPFRDLDVARAEEAKQKAIDVQKQLAVQEKKWGDDGALRKALEPLARAYAGLPYPHRLGFELWVLSVLRRKG